MADVGQVLPHVTVAEHAGACFGVDRALSLAYTALRNADGPVRTLGPLIHNQAVVDELTSRGASPVDTPEGAAGMTLVLRAHGVTPDEEALARGACASVVDATCPLVARVHRAAEELATAGYQVLVVGEATHPEVIGILAHAPGSMPVGGAAELVDVRLSGRVGVIVQTTQPLERLREVVDAIVARGVVRDLRVINTICDATTRRQLAAVRLARQSDVMVVVGGRRSANTTHLARLCAQECDRTHHVELPSELEGAWFTGALAIGVTAGASTPGGQVNEVVTAIERLCGVTHG